MSSLYKQPIRMECSQPYQLWVSENLYTVAVSPINYNNCLVVTAYGEVGKQYAAALMGRKHMKGKLFSFIAVDDNTPIQKLHFSEQLRVLIQRMTNESKEQLKADDAETVYQASAKGQLAGVPSEVLKARQE